MPDYDAIDERIRMEREAKWQQREGPRVGDFVIMQDGTLRRFTHDWDNALQTTVRDCPGSFYFDRAGYMSYSGGLDPCIPKCRLTDTGQVASGKVWFFHHDEHRGHNGVTGVRRLQGLQT
jgi:hypothetical protein